jgi:predicted O-linked N-acetylglucosamine transferase (SPINDLY family)
MVAMWVQVMQQLPGSRLLLLASEGSHRQKTLDRLKEGGIDPSRVEFFGHQARWDYLRLYQRIDFGLDSFPYNGHTTSLDSFWMGAPVVTLVGESAVARAGWCQLSNLGLTELAARSNEEFASIAVDLAKDLPRLVELRSTLRAKMERSPLMDGPKFARNVEASYRQMWKAWVAAPSPARV